MNETRILKARYRLDRPLSRNGASTTWLAHDLDSDVPCVVKELSVATAVREGNSELSYDGDFTKVIELFEREARVLAHLDHPGIPRFFDHFSEEVDGDTRLYTAQEYVAGANLEQLVQTGRHVTEEEAREICRAVAEILAYLHGRSPPLIHRDIKPSNVILGADGAVRLVDFGSVRNHLEPEPLDGKTIVGTYGYMPIEQYEARAVPQSDLYALGMTLVFLLSHRSPTEIPRKGLFLDFRPYVQVSERFARLIGWMIEPAAESRPPDARAVLDLLDDRRGNLPELSPTAGEVAGPEAAARRRRIAATAALAAGLLGVLIGVLGLFFSAGAPLEPDAGVDAPPAGVIGGGSVPRPDETGPVDGVLTIDLDEDFVYVASGFPMGRASHQTTLPPLSLTPPNGVERVLSDAPVWYGSLDLGNGSDRRVDFALVDDPAGRVLWFDRNNDELLTNDGGPVESEARGDDAVFAATLSVDVEVHDGADTFVRPYRMWLWFLPTRDAYEARMYAQHHYAGRVRVGDRVHQATIYEQSGHDALYRDAGVCIDLDDDGRCDEDAELFHDGDFVQTPTGRFRLELDYP